MSCASRFRDVTRRLRTQLGFERLAYFMSGESKSKP